MASESILVADDEPSIVQLCERILTGEGYIVQGVTSGHDAIAWLEAERFDLLLVDIKMPDVDGLTVLRRGREIDPQLTAVVITGHTTMENAIATLHAGAHRLVLKPFSSVELLPAVRDALAQRRSDQERQRLRAQLPILQIAQVLATEGDPGLLAEQLLEPVAREVPVDRAVLFLAERGDILTVAGVIGLPPPDPSPEARRVGLSRRAAGLLQVGSEPLRLAGVGDLDPPLQDLLNLPEDAAIVWLPLRTLKRCVGALVLARSLGHPPFTPSELNLLSIVGGQIAAAIESAQLYELIARGKREWEETFDAIADGISIHDSDWRIVRANKALARQLGRTVRELIGRRCYEIIHRTSAPLDVCPMRAALASGRPQEVQMEDRGLAGVFLCQVYPVHDELGSIRGAVHVLRDVTARHRAEQELHRRNVELTALNTIATTIGQSLDLDHILNTTLDKAMEVLETDGGWIELLDEAGGSLHVAVQRGLPATVDETTSAALLDGSLSGRVVRSGELLVVHRDSDLPLPPALGGVEILALVPIQAKDRVMGVLVAFRRTPRELSPEQLQVLGAIGHQLGVAVENARLARQSAEVQVLRELDRLRSELIANVSHELRTPLGLIKVFGTTLLRDDLALDSATQREFLSDIVDETGKLEKIVDNLLDLSRMEEERLLLRRESVDVGQLARRVIAGMQTRVTEHRLVDDFPTGALLAEADPQRIEQVLRNLLDNAIKYSPGGGAIAVRGRREGDEVVVRVSDQGIGIPNGELERVFERFYRVENDVTGRQRGAGLGLAVCRGVIEAHGGRIWAESTPGAGSTFIFTLPVGGKAGAP